MLLLFAIIIIQALIIIGPEVCNAIRVNSYCGDPGLPADASLYNVNVGRIRFTDGEVVRYRCPPEFHTFSQTRQCVSGRWVGERARCGVSIEINVKSVQVFDCNVASVNTTNHTNKEILNLVVNQTENPLLFANSFHASRLMTGPITVNGSTCYLWKFTLNKPTMIPFLTIDFATQLNTEDTINNSFIELNTTSLQKDIITVEPFVSPYRVCRSLHKLDLINGDPVTNETFLLNGYYYRCDSIGEDEYNIESKKVSQTLLVETRTNRQRDIHLVALFLASHKTDSRTGRPLCGKPETVTTGVNFRESNLGIPQFQFQCNDSFIDVTPNKPNKAKSEHWYSVNCTVNGLWEGQFPQCIPKVECPGISYLQETKDPSVTIETIENVFFINKTNWVASEHSQVNYACVDTEHIVVGKLSRTCLKSGEWSLNIPKCSAYLKPESLSPVAQYPWTVIAILIIVLMIFLSLVFIIVRKYVSNMRKELLRYRNKSRRHKQSASVYTDVRSNSISIIYDDCASSPTFSKSYGNRMNRSTKKSHKYKYDAEYIELEGNSFSTISSSEPLYIPILPSN